MRIDNPIISGSLIVSGSTTITGVLSASSFIGDGSGLTGVTSYTDSDTLSYINSLGVLSGSIDISKISGSNYSTFDFTNTGSITINHNLNTLYPLVQVYDNTNSIIIPQTVQSISTNSTKIVFGSLETGKIILGKGGDVISSLSQSFADWNQLPNKPSGIVSSSAQVSFTTISDKPTLVSGSSQISFTGITNKPILVSGSSQIIYNQISNIPSGIISSSNQLSNQTIPGNLTITGKLTAQEFHTEFVSASIIYDSGSTQFGNSLDDIHNFSGSLAVNTNNLFVSGGRVGIGTTSPSQNLHIFSNSPAGILLKGADANVASNIKLEHGGGGGRTGVDGTWNISFGSDETYFGGLDMDGGLAFWFQSGSNFSDVLRLKSNNNAIFSGNVGIGTTSPVNKLSVVGGIQSYTETYPYYVQGSLVGSKTTIRVNNPGASLISVWGGTGWSWYTSKVNVYIATSGASYKRTYSGIIYRNTSQVVNIVNESSTFQLTTSPNSGYFGIAFRENSGGVGPTFNGSPIKSDFVIYNNTGQTLASAYVTIEVIGAS